MRRGRDYSTLLIYAALGVTIPRYIGAFVASDMGRMDGWVSSVLSVLVAVSGVGMGILDILGMAYVFDGWRAKLPKSGDHWSSRFKVLTAFVVGLAVCGVGILAPFTVARVQQAGMADVLPGPWLAIWAVLVNIAPLCLVGGVIVGQSGVVSVQHAQHAPDAVHMQSTPVQPATSVRRACAQCGASFSSNAKYAAHVRWCKSNRGRAEDVLERAR